MPTPRKKKSLLACRLIGRFPTFVPKLAWRKRMPGGCISQRPCIFPLNTDRGRALSPIHWLRPLVRHTARSGQLLFRPINARNVNRVIRRAFTTLGVPAAVRYSSHGFRRAPGQEIKESGPQWPIVASVGQWGGLPFRNYVDISDELSRDMAQLFIHPYDFASGVKTKRSQRYGDGVTLASLPTPLKTDYPAGGLWIIHGVCGFK